MTSLHPRQQLAGRLLGRGAIAGALLYACMVWANQPPATETVPLTVEADTAVGSAWSIKKAEITENFHFVYASLHVKNISAQPQKQAAFYAEYFDGRGRLCYTALFDLQKNLSRRKGPLLPGGSRTLLSDSFDIALASRPRFVKVYLFGQSLKGTAANHAGKMHNTYTPPMLQATTEQPWEMLCLGPLYSRPRKPVVDIALMVVDVDATGSVEGFKVLDAAATVPFVSWAEEFVKHIRFSPARRNREDAKGKTLVLFRAILGQWTKDDPAHVPSSNPWVARYVESESARRIPFVTVVVLQPPPPNATPTQGGSTSVCVQYLGVGTYWSEGITVRK